MKWTTHAAGADLAILTWGGNVIATLPAYVAQAAAERLNELGTEPDLSRGGRTAAHQAVA